MRVVNLAREPYLNHRPVFRLSILLWAIGGILLLVNGWQYWTHWSGVGRNQSLLEGLASAIRQEEAELRARDAELGEVDIWSENTRARYVNALISQRKFPWSALFEDLEGILPAEIRLSTVQPAVRLANDPDNVAKAHPKKRRQSRRRSEQAKSTPVVPAREVEKPDEVWLTLKGSARKEEALMDFVDSLYQDETFLNPDLSTEQLDTKAGSSQFNIRVLYLTRRPTAGSSEQMIAEDQPIAEYEKLTEALGSTIEPGSSRRGDTHEPSATVAAGSNAGDESESNADRFPATPSGGSTSRPSPTSAGDGSVPPRRADVTSDPSATARSGRKEGRANATTGQATERGQRATGTHIPRPPGQGSPDEDRRPTSPAEDPQKGSVREPEPGPTTTVPNASDNLRIRGGGAEIARVSLTRISPEIVV